MTTVSRFESTRRELELRGYGGRERERVEGGEEVGNWRYFNVML